MIFELRACIFHPGLGEDSSLASPYNWLNFTYTFFKFSLDSTVIVSTEMNNFDINQP